MVKLALIQMSMTSERESNENRALSLVEQACEQGAQIVLLPELFSGLYFPQHQKEVYFKQAVELETWKELDAFRALAKKYRAVLPLSFFERDAQAYYNSLVLLDGTGESKGLYRKSHIPDGPGYTEKYYFNPGDTGLKVFDTLYGKIGCGICWDQWFPEAARIMTLKGADLLLYPTAIGSEPEEADQLDTSLMWQKAMVGHSVCNAVYVAASNRVGTEENCDFYGSTFLSDYKGDILAEADKANESILYSDLDFDTQRSFRAGMGFFRDRRPDLYSDILSLDGHTKSGE